MLVLDLAGTFAFGLSGGLVGVRARLYKHREDLFKTYQRAHRVLLSRDPPRSW